ncbi:hypothetical protein Pelo_7632 [Pelomyxa schiedti]|nr:hypothetical protein Pelo_7632 [Pelomyxa schiedti]
MEHVENKSFLGACTSAQRLLRRKESLYLCISLCCILTDSFFDILNLKGHRFEACLIFSDSGFHVDIDLGNFSLPAAGLESGGCRLKLMAYPKPKVEIQTNLKFSNGLQMTAVLKGTVVPPSLVASLSLESEIPLSTFHHSLSHLAIYGLRGELTLAPSCVSIFFSGGVRTTWTDGPAPAFAAAFRVTFSAGLVSPTTVYLFCDNLTIGAVIRIFRRCSYADVEALDRALPNIKELGLLLKLDNEELTSLPQPKDRADNSLLRLIQNKTQRTTPLLEATENFIGFTAHLSWLGLEAKVLLGLLTNINVSGGPPSAALELSIAIRNWTCTVRSTILFILGQCEVTLSVDTARRTAGFSFTTQITILPSILDLSLSSEIRFSCAPSSLFLSVEIRISLLRTPNCEENTVVLANSEAQPNCGVEMGGVLQVTWTKGLPSIQARLNCRNIECSSVVSAILDGLHDCIRGITQLCLRGLRRAQRIVSRFLPEFVQGLLVDMVQMAADVAEAVESGHINTLKETLMNMCEGKLLVKNLSIGGPVSSEKSSAKVIVTYDIIMSGQAIKGTMGVNLKTLLSDIAKKLLQFLLKWKSNKSKTPEEHKPPSLDPDSSYKTERASSIPLEHYAEMKYDRDGTVSPEDPLALQLTTRDLNDPLLCDVPVIKQQVFECQLCKKRVSEASLNRHVDICAANVKSKCPLCGVEVMAVDQERHMAVECSKRQESRSEICEYCTMEVEPGRKREHHNNLCQGQWECPKCNSKMVRKEQYHHLTGSCPNRAPGDVCGRCKCFRDSTHVMFCMNCRKEFKVCKVHSCQKTVECQHCKICVPRGSEEMHWRDECTAAPIACAVCGCPLAPGKPAWERKKEHSTSCPGRHVICRYCMELFPLNQIAEHKFSCQRRLRLCRVKNCGYKVSNEDYNSVYKYTSCPFCYTPSNSYLELRRHLREDACPKYRMLELRCSFCGDPFIMRSLAAHLKGCKRFQVPCPTCPGKFTLKKLRKHILRRALRLDKTCSMPLPCPYCMQPSFFFDSPANGSAPSIREHLLWCTKAPRFCGFCQSPLLGCNQVHHLQFECEEFKVPCFFCSSKVAMHCLPSHLRCCKCIKLACIFPDCHAEPMTFDELEEHLKLECDYFFVSCLVCHCPVLKKEEKVHWQLHKSAQCIQNLPPDCFLASTTYGNNLHHLIPLEKKHLVGRDRTSLHRLAKVRFLSEDAIQQEEGANLLPCPRCHETIAHYDLIEHLNFFCPSNLQTCPLDCGWDGPVCHMFKHLTEQCYLAEGGCIYDPGCCELPAWQFRFQQELALVLYPAEKLDIEMQEVGVYHLVKNHFTQVQENSGCSDMEAEEALYTSLCTTLHRQKKHIGLRKRDETRHAIFCEKRGELCFFCCHYVTDLPHHIQSCPASIQKTLCNYCGEKVACFQIIYHWLYLCTSSQFSVNCPNCKKYIPYRDLDLHLARDCAASSVSCPCCASHIEVKDYPAHILQSCKRSGVNTRCGFCRQQCPSTEILEGLHQTNCKRCNLRRCPFGATEEHARTGSRTEIESSASKATPRECCQRQVPMCGLVEHLIPDVGDHICRSLSVPCPFEGCTAKFPMKNLTHHTEHECEKNRVSCEKCGLDFPKKSQYSHAQICTGLGAQKVKCEMCLMYVPACMLVNHQVNTCPKRTVLTHPRPFIAYRHQPLRLHHTVVPSCHVVSNTHSGSLVPVKSALSLLLQFFGSKKKLIYTCCGGDENSEVCPKPKCRYCQQALDPPGAEKPTGCCTLCGCMQDPHGTCTQCACTKAPTGMCTRCGTELNRLQQNNECVSTCLYCNTPESEWEGTRCSHWVCTQCNRSPTNEGCCKMAFDEVPWEMKEKGYFQNKAP